MDKTKNDVPTCFVIMPISDVSGYDGGHFTRVYQYLIRPACEAAGFAPIRADDVASSNHIVIDILKKIIESEIVLCDLSARNPNVLYELGLRQAFNKPAALIKDDKTPDTFDIQGLRYFSYDHQLRIDNVKKEIEQIRRSIVDTYEKRDHDVNSVVQLLGIEPAKLEGKVKLSQENSVLLEAISGITKRLGNIERQYKNTNKRVRYLSKRIPDDYAPLKQYFVGKALDQAIGKEFYINGDVVGTFIDYSLEEGYVDFAKGDGEELIRIEIESDLFNEINQLPF